MRDHNEVNWSFLAVLYTFVSGLVFYTIVEFLKGFKSSEADKGDEKENLRFSRIFVRKQESDGDSDFDKYYKIR